VAENQHFVSPGFARFCLGSWGVARSTTAAEGEQDENRRLAEGGTGGAGAQSVTRSVENHLRASGNFQDPCSKKSGKTKYRKT